METQSVGMQNLVVNIGQIESNPDNFRKKFKETGEGSIEELGADLKKNGMQNPIVVKKNKPGSKIPYRINQGERRWRAAKMAGLEHVPVRILPDDVSEEQMDTLQLVENINRENLTTYETAHAFATMIGKHKLTAAEVARRCGRSATYVNRLVKPYSELNPEIRKAWENEHEAATIVTLGKLVSKFGEHDEQMEAWQNYCEFGTFEAPEGEDDDDGEGEGESNGDSEKDNGSKKFKVKPGQVLERYGYANKSINEQSTYDGAWVLAVLRYVVGKRAMAPEGIKIPEQKGKGPSKPAKTRKPRELVS